MENVKDNAVNVATNVNLLNEVENRWIFINEAGQPEFAWSPAPGDEVKLAVHDGQFHADELLAVCLLELFWLEREAIVDRTRNPEYLKDYIRIDVGEGIFDHHGVRAEPGVAACSRVWEVLKRSGLVPEYAQEAIDDLVEVVAAWDTGDSSKGESPLAFVHAYSTAATALTAGGDCGKWLPRYTYEVEMFLSARSAVRDFLQAKLAAAHAADKARDAAEACIDEAGDDAVVVFNRASRCAPVKEMLWDRKSPAVYYISQEGDEDWRILCAADPTAEEFSFFSSRRLLKDEFRGLRGDELSSKSGIPGGIFCHAAGFIAGFKTREAAVEFARINL